MESNQVAQISPQISSLKQRVALYLSCRKLKNMDLMSKSDPQVEVYLKDKHLGQWSLVGKTEIVNNNLNPDFSVFIQCDYYFEREQYIKFAVYDIDNNQGGRDFIGKNETTLGKLIGSPKQTYVSDLMDDKSTASRGKLIVRLDNVKVSNDEVRFRLSGNLVSLSSCCGGVNNPYFVILKERGVNNTSGDFVRVFQSPHLINIANPIWAPQKLKFAQLCNADKNLNFKVEVYTKDEAATDKLYGSAITNMERILNGEKRLDLANNRKRAGAITFDQISIIEMPNFMEYLRSGWAINMSFAIDFTASNGELSHPASLHRQDPTGRVLNQYEQALLAVGQVMEPYAMNSQFATFGFGGIPRFMGLNSVSHCFNLSGQPNPQITGLQNVFKAYKNVINMTGLAGPTYFAPLLQSLMVYVQQCLQFQMYHCLMILTDGEIHDMDKTVDMIVELSKFPVSIIIIGVGNEGFEKMQFLDSDDKVLRNYNNQAAQRDIVQFVRFQDYIHSDISLLAEEVLREMPEQIVGYMLANNIKPNKQDWLSIDDAVQNHAYRTYDKGGMCYAACQEAFEWWNSSVFWCQKGCDLSRGRMSDPLLRDEAENMCKMLASNNYGINDHEDLDHVEDKRIHATMYPVNATNLYKACLAGVRRQRF